MTCFNEIPICSLLQNKIIANKPFALLRLTSLIVKKSFSSSSSLMFNWNVSHNKKGFFIDPSLSLSCRRYAVHSPHDLSSYWSNKILPQIYSICIQAWNLQHFFLSYFFWQECSFFPQDHLFPSSNSNYFLRQKKGEQWPSSWGVCPSTRASLVWTHDHVYQ
jgi:hypothetical protein